MPAVAARKRANRASGVRVVLHARRFVAEEEREAERTRGKRRGGEEGGGGQARVRERREGEEDCRASSFFAPLVERGIEDSRFPKQQRKIVASGGDQVTIREPRGNRSRRRGLRSLDT